MLTPHAVFVGPAFVLDFDEVVAYVNDTFVLRNGAQVPLPPESGTARAGTAPFREVVLATYRRYLHETERLWDDVSGRTD